MSIVRSAVAGLVSLAIGAIAQAGPGSVTFQGVALDPDGSPINGSRDLVIRIYDDPVAADPAHLVYQESRDEPFGQVEVRDTSLTVIFLPTTY